MLADPMHQFQITPLIPIEVGGVDISFTNSALWVLIGAVLSIVIMGLAASRKSIVPGRIQLIGEEIYGFVEGMVTDNIGQKGKEYFPLVFTVFMIVAMGNMLGMIPYSFTYTSHLAVTASMALMIFAIVLLVGIIRHGFHFFSLFVPSDVPIWMMPLVVAIEIVSFISRPVTLSVRLFANMVAGHVLMKVIAGFAIMFASMGGVVILGSILPVAFNVVMIGFEFFIAFIQAYVFAVLTCIYLKDTIEIAH
ncbi:MAG TPA: F0F1 ATP synthase subunit A [Alphaproteobacteria bacterium]|nr:F0F1 ATP synthase subunit A [Alphaproteobacteria bacterium]